MSFMHMKGLVSVSVMAMAVADAYQHINNQQIKLTKLWKENLSEYALQKTYSSH